MPATRNEKFRKDFDLISTMVCHWMKDYRLDDYFTFHKFITDIPELSKPITPQTEAFIESLYIALTQPENAHRRTQYQTTAGQIC